MCICYVRIWYVGLVGCCKGGSVGMIMLIDCVFDLIVEEIVCVC